MASPTSNFLTTTDFDPALTGAGRFVAAGTKWGGALGTGVTISFSFPTGTASFAPGYGEGEFDSWHSLSSGERAAVRTTLAVWSKYANVTFSEIADNSTTVGEMRFAHTENISAESAAHAYYPGNYVEAGDVWFNWFNFNPDGLATIKAGSYDYLTILHEIGHALGLKHSFETPNPIPGSLDSYFYSIMSYTASPWSADQDNYATFYPTTPMYYDLLAIQAIYGTATSVNPGNTTYTFTDGNKYWQTINDTGGTDTIVYNGSEASSINLNPGQFSKLSEAIGFSNGATSRATVTIGPGVVIENATGGSGNDTLTGNASNNVLNGRGGSDTMSGGAGNDTFIVDVSTDKIVEASGAGSDTVQTGAFSVSLSKYSYVENVTLTGSSAIGATGNATTNYLTGHNNSAANTLTGLGGNDTYTVGAGDKIVEASGGGIDTVQSITLNLNLAAFGYVENITLLGTANLSATGNASTNVLTGNSGSNTISGNAGGDTIAGGLGVDTLSGGAGGDYFVFNTAPHSSTNRDNITDFESADTIWLENAIFTSFIGVGTISSAFFHLGVTPSDADDYILYDQSNGALYYDRDGDGSAAAAVQFATLTNHAVLTYADFVVI
jgi:serralysin